MLRISEVSTGVTNRGSAHPTRSCCRFSQVAGLCPGLVAAAASAPRDSILARQTCSSDVRHSTTTTLALCCASVAPICQQPDQEGIQHHKNMAKVTQFQFKVRSQYLHTWVEQVIMRLILLRAHSFAKHPEGLEDTSTGSVILLQNITNDWSQRQERKRTGMVKIPVEYLEC